jgi:hypothetical protein
MAVREQDGDYGLLPCAVGMSRQQGPERQSYIANAGATVSISNPSAINLVCRARRVLPTSPSKHAPHVRRTFVAEIAQKRRMANQQCVHKILFDGFMSCGRSISNLSLFVGVSPAQHLSQRAAISHVGMDDFEPPDGGTILDRWSPFKIALTPRK